MYIGIDFLIEKGEKLYLSEVNTGVPAGAFEYDLVYYEQFGRSSGVFDKIEEISERNFNLPFREYIRSLPYINELRMLKIWMDGRGPLPGNIPPELQLEDKWVQYRILSQKTDMLPTVLYDGENREFYRDSCPENKRFVLKRRLGRNGRGFRIFERHEKIGKIEEQADSYILQPWIDSSIAGLKMSVRAAAFCGEFICMFASLSPREVSNHGYRFYIEPGNRFDLSKKDFRLMDITKKAWEADILYGDSVPSYLEESVTIERISNGRLVIPSGMYSNIQKIASVVSTVLMEIDPCDI